MSNVKKSNMSNNGRRVLAYLQENIGAEGLTANSIRDAVAAEHGLTKDEFPVQSVNGSLNNLCQKGFCKRETIRITYTDNTTEDVTNVIVNDSIANYDPDAEKEVLNTEVVTDAMKAKEKAEAEAKAAARAEEEAEELED